MRRQHVVSCFRDGEDDALTFSNQSVVTSQFTKKRTYVSNAKNDATSMLSFTILGRMA